MAAKTKKYDSKEIRTQLEKLVSSYSTTLATYDLRTKVISIIPIRKSIKNLGISLLPKDIDSALNRILYYLKQYPRRIIGVDELAIVSGIEEYARRIRQLRVEFGWKILSGKTAREVAIDGRIEGIDVTEMKVNEYILLSVENDKEAAYRWNLANTIKKSKGGAKVSCLGSFKRTLVT